MTASPWDCPFCGRMSAEEPALRRARYSHTVLTPVASAEPRNCLFAVSCWHCGARGPLASSVRIAVKRWQHSANRNGAPRW